jgi:hypothetical protein
VSTKVNKKVANTQKPYEGMPVEITIEHMQPEKLLSFRWHPHAVESDVDYSSEPMTLIVFELEKANSIRFTITESGFDKIPLERRAKAFTANEQGMGIMIKLIKEYTLNKFRNSKAKAASKRTAPLFAALCDQARLWIVSRLCDEGPLSIANWFVRHSSGNYQTSPSNGEKGFVQSAWRGRESVWQLDEQRLE